MNALQHVANNNNITTLVWVPVHSGIDGNERSGCPAREFAKRPNTHSRLFYGIPLLEAKSTLSKWMNDHSTLGNNRGMYPLQDTAQNSLSMHYHCIGNKQTV